MMNISGNILHFFQRTDKKKQLTTALEILLIVIWALWVGRSYLKLDSHTALGASNDDFLISIYPYFPLTRLLHCGDCVLWNGLLNGGSPTFGDTIGAVLHPVMLPLILVFGVLNGIKLAMVAALIMGGLALWWIAKVLKLGIVPRLWISLLGVVAGNLAGPLYSGDVGIVFSVAATGLVIAPGLTLALYGRRRDAIIFGLILAQAFLSGQGYLQMALVLCLLPVFLIFIIDGNFILKPLWKELLIALVIALFVSAIFILPAFSLSTHIIKPTDPQSSQPLEYIPINLIVRDMNFFASTALEKLASPNLYIQYIGWTPIIFAILAWRFISKKSLRIYLFFIISMFLIFGLGSSTFLTWMKTWLHNFLSDIRNPIFGVGLAVTLILGLSAWGLDRFLRLDWPHLLISSGFNKPNLKIDTRIFVIPLLVWSISSVYQFNDQFRVSVPWPINIVQAAESISPYPARWVRPIYGNWTFTAAAINHNIKVTGGYRIWDLKDYPNPSMSMDVSQDPNMQADPNYIGSVNDVYFVSYPENPYAYIDAGTTLIPCSAKADGGHIDVICQSDQVGTLIVQENALTGWIAWCDNKRTDLIPGQWLSVSTSAGEHSYKFRYIPMDFFLGLLLALLGLGFAIWLWVKPQPEPTPGLASLDN